MPRSTMMTNSTRILSSVLTVALATALTTAMALTTQLGSATAQAPEGGPSEADLAAAKVAYGSGAEAFHKNKFKEAVKFFKESYRLSKNPVLLYNIGYALESSGDKKLALFYYKKFLSDTPKDAANRDTAKERAEALSLDLADSQEPDPGKTKVDPDPGKTNPDPKTAETPDGFQHNVIEEVPPGKPVDVTAFAPKNIGWKVLLHYRVAGAAKFTTIEMVPRYSELVARIPAAQVRGSTIQYYVEARDIGDEMAARSGKATSPHVVLIEDTAKARFYPDFDGGGATATGGDDIEFPGGSNQGKDTGPTDQMTYLKWGATGASIGFVALSVTFLAIASDANSSIEGAAFESAQGNCPQGNPCRDFSDTERDFESRGKRYQTLGNVFLGLGVAAGATAGVLWYLESKKKKKAGKTDRVTTLPAVGPDFVGASATVRF